MIKVRFIALGIILILLSALSCIGAQLLWVYGPEWVYEPGTKTISVLLGLPMTIGIGGLFFGGFFSILHGLDVLP